MTRDKTDAENVQISERKTKLRKAMASRLRAMTIEERAAGSRRVCAQIQADFSEIPARGGLVLGFAADATEPDLLALGAGFGGSWRLCLPKVLPGGELALYEVTGADCLESGAYGLREPSPHKCAKRELCDVGFLLVPGRAFDSNGARLGRGGGFYDRLLVGRGDSPAVGACFRLQLVDQVPEESHDARVDAVIAG